MTMAITRGTLSHSYNQALEHDRVENLFSDQTLEYLKNYDILTINSERQEILLKIRDPVKFKPEDIRAILQNLQEQNQRSFVALINMASQCILITIRG
ncbi:MAG: hypothetical protein ACFFBD_16925 [Candidatus Hodarchaeota archaeon]